MKNDLIALAIMFLCFAGVLSGLIYNGDDNGNQVVRSLDGKGNKMTSNMYGFSFYESTSTNFILNKKTIDKFGE
ncbi:hypothetical protein GC098_25585 [Paenibacillus sp. LMG 31458]|uniref:Uncharacterized protein n=1 Tax=Paenibacillus phytorum TaxID=2654977 RepID=A0ABX1Y1P6_9BACL|nr:hypothetical protein [Paenibacillus phytorum]NOU74718.1 hypothetical protein [Paenibacillus phytorum]